MTLFAGAFKKKPLPPPIISVGPVPIKLGDMTQDEIHRPWRLAKSIVGEGGYVSLLGGIDDKEHWNAAYAMAKHYGLKMQAQLRERGGIPSHGRAWVWELAASSRPVVRGIEVVDPASDADGLNMSSVVYDLPPLDDPEFVARRKARDAALKMKDHVAFSVYPQLSGLHDIDAVKRYLAPLVVACKRWPGTKWVSELGVSILWSAIRHRPIDVQEMANRGANFQREVVEYVVSIPGLAGVNYTLVCDSPGYAETCKDRGGLFWLNQGLFDVDGNERPAAGVLRKAAGR
ncbi:MAG: hypothetical protein ACKV2Q_36410 [Planctomycetaceae bacterium]